MAMEQLAAAVRAPSPPALPGSARLPFAFSTRFPLQPLLRKELAEHYVSLGVMGAALKVCARGWVRLLLHELKWRAWHMRLPPPRASRGMRLPACLAAALTLNP